MNIDLSHPLSESTPSFPGDPKTSIRQLRHEGGDGILTGEISCGLHTGTHLDAPAHFIKGGRLVSDYPADRFFGRGVLIDARGKEKIDVDALGVKEIRNGDIILVLTGWDKKYQDQGYFKDYPEVTENFAKNLIALGVKMIGLDSPSPDKFPFPIHRMLLAKDILIIENLTNLEALLPYEIFKIVALPAKIAAEAAFCRAVVNV